MKLIPTLFTVVCMTGTFSAPASVRSADTLAGQAPATPRYIADEVAAIVGGSHILLSDIERTTGEVLKLRQQQGTLSGRPARYEAFETLLLQKMLAEQARADSLDKDLSGGLDDQVEHQIQEMVKEAGSV